MLRRLLSVVESVVLAVVRDRLGGGIRRRWYQGLVEDVVGPRATFDVGEDSARVHVFSGWWRSLL